MAAPAFACTAILGKISITATHNGVNKTVEWHGDGGDPTVASRGYCDPLTRSSWTTPSSQKVLMMTVSVRKSSKCVATTMPNFPNPVWQVRWVKAQAAAEHDGAPGKPDCNRPLPEANNNLWAPLGTLTVNSSTGAGSTNIRLVDGSPASMMRGHGNICVSQGSSLAYPMAFITWI